jgi:DNA-binding PucR family transcriptional regulator
MRRWIGALIDYDEKRNADLVTTLGALLEGRGLRQAAEQLVIHVSTLKYRIKRINEILGLDYHDPEIAFNLQLAVRLYRISRGGRSAEPPERTTS